VVSGVVFGLLLIAGFSLVYYLARGFIPPFFLPLLQLIVYPAGSQSNQIILVCVFAVVGFVSGLLKSG